MIKTKDGKVAMCTFLQLTSVISFALSSWDQGWGAIHSTYFAACMDFGAFHPTHVQTLIVFSVLSKHATNE